MNLMLCLTLNYRYFFTIINAKENIRLSNTKQILHLIKQNQAKKFPSHRKY